MANSAFRESKEGMEMLKREVESITSHFEAMVRGILKPEPEEDLSKNPFFAAGMSGLEKLKWDYRVKAETKARMAA